MSFGHAVNRIHGWGILVCLLSAMGAAAAETPAQSSGAPALLAEKYRMARALVDAARCADAVPMLREIAENPSGADLSLSSAMLLLDCEVKTRNLDLLAQDSTKLCAVPSLTQDAAFQRLCSKLEAGLARQKMESLVKENKPKRAAELAIEFIGKHPDDPKLDELLYNAGVWFDQAGDFAQAQRARLRLLAVKPESPLSMRALQASAARYEQVGAYARAASCLEELAAKRPNETERSVAALQTALNHRVNIGDAKRAQSDFDQFIKQYGSQPAHRETAALMFLGMARLYLHEGPTQRENLEAHLREYLRTWSKFGGGPAELIATAGLAELLWERSCPVPMVDGICASQRVAKERLSNEPPSGLVKRTASLEKEAMTLFERVAALWLGLASSGSAPTSVDDSSPKAQQLERAKQAAERVRFLRDDAAYERSLRGSR